MKVCPSRDARTKASVLQLPNERQWAMGLVRTHNRREEERYINRAYIPVVGGRKRQEMLVLKEKTLKGQRKMHREVKLKKEAKIHGK